MNFFNVHISERSKELVNQVLSGDWIGEGPMVAEFEKKLAAFGMANPVTVNSGTAALHLALVIARVGHGDTVIVPAQTFAATAMVVKMVGAIPVFSDIDPKTGNIDPVDIERKADNADAIIPVHYGGLPCNMDEINRLAEKYGLTIIEDAAHALGAVYHGKPVGSISRFTCFSFQAIKHITTGDGGALCCLYTDDAQEAYQRRWFGIDRVHSANSELGNREYPISQVGFKYHMNDITAAIGIGNLDEFPNRLKARQEIGAFYREYLAGVPGLELLRIDPDIDHAYWLFTVLVEKRLEFIRALKERGIPASVCMRRIDDNPVFGGRRNDLPGTDYFDEHQVSIPCHDGLTADDLGAVIRAIWEGWA